MDLLSTFQNTEVYSALSEIYIFAKTSLLDG